MKKFFRKAVGVFLIGSLLFTAVPVYAGVLTAEPDTSTQGSGFDPTVFGTTITLDASILDENLGTNEYNTLTNALNAASTAVKPVLLQVVPGAYSSISNLIKFNDLVIRGIGSNPGDVVFTTTNGSCVIELSGANELKNIIIENITLKLTYEAPSPKQTTGIHFQGAGLKSNMIFRNLIIDATTPTLNTITANGIYLFNAKNITVDNVIVTVGEGAKDTSRAVAINSTSDSAIKEVSGNCTIPVSILDYYDAMTPAAAFPDNNYVEDAEFLIVLSRLTRCSYMIASTYEEASAFISLLQSDSNNTLRALVDVENNQLIVDDDISGLDFDSVKAYLEGTQGGLSNTALSRERADENNWYDTKNVALVDPSGDYQIDIEGLTITAYDQNYNADSFVPIGTATFSGQPITLNNFDFSALSDPTIQGLIDAGIIPAGSVIPTGNGDADGTNNKVYARMTFDTQGGILDPTFAFLVCGLYDGLDASLPQPTRANYQFAGWYTEPNGAGSNQLYLESEGLTVYANWITETPAPTPNPTQNGASPQTGDFSQPAALAMVMLMAIIGLAVLLRQRKKSLN